MDAKQLAKWKACGGADPQVLGIHGPLPVNPEPMDPARLEFIAKAKTRGQCGGCAFSSQPAAVCNKAGGEARMRGLPACDDGFVFVLAPAKNPKQLPLLEE